MAKDPRDIIKRVSDAFGTLDEERARENNRVEDERKNLITGLGTQITDLVRPLLEKLANQAKINSEDLRDAISEIKVEAPKVEIPPVVIPTIKVPEPKVTVNVPPVKVPEINIPAPVVKFPTEMLTRLQGINNKSPLAVQMVDPAGNPLLPPFGGGTGSGKTSDVVKGMFGNVPRAIEVDEGGRVQVDIISGGGGGTQYDEDAAHTSGDTGTLALVVRQDTPANLSGTDGDYEGLSVSDGLLWTRIRDIQASAGASLINPDGRFQVAVDQTGAGTQYTEGDTDTTITGQAMFAEGGDNDAAGDVLRVLQMGGGVSSSAVRVLQATDAVASTDVRQLAGTDIAVDSGVTGAGVQRVVHVTDVGASTNVIQLGGTNISTNNGTSDAGTQRVTIASDTTGVLSIDDNGGNISIDDGGNVISVDDGAGSLTVDQATASSLNAEVQGDVAHDAAVGGNPLLGGGEARTTNPTAVGDGDAVRSQHDDVGRQVVYPYTVRDLTNTAYVSLSNGTETTFLAATAGAFNDLISVMGANQSDAAVTLDIRMVTAGNVVMSLEIPANSTAGIVPAVPYPQSDTGNNWTIDMGDITGTTVDVTGLFVQNV